MNFADIPNPSAQPPAPKPVAAKAEPKAEQVVPEATVGDVASKAAEAKPEAKAEAGDAKKFKLNIKGKEIEITEDQAIAMLQKAAYADQQIKEAAQAKKGAEGLIQRLKENPWEVLADPAVGHDVKQLAVKKIKEFMDEEAKDPKERELEMTRKELEAYKKQEAEAKRAAEEAEKAKAIKDQADAMRTEIISAMDANKDVLPKSQAVMDRLIGYMRAGYKKTGKVLPASEAIKYVIADYKAEVNDVFKTADVSKLVELFGPEVIKKLREADLSKLKQGNESQLKGENQPKPELPVNKKGKIPEKKYEKFWKDRIAGL